MSSRVPTTLHELLLEMRQGLSLFCPILITVRAETELLSDSTTIERTLTGRVVRDWADEYSREYGDESFLMLGANELTGGLDKRVTIGRSRKCDVRIENDSVSKLHASITFDRSTASYVLVDEDSRNGSSLNGEPLSPLTPVSLWPGAYLSFGDAVFVFIDPPTLRKLAARQPAR